jgi:hypothetical protein
MGWAAVSLMLAAPALGGTTYDHSALDRVQATYVDDRGRVDYAGLKANQKDLIAYVTGLEQVSPESHPGRFPAREDRMAYWMNAYNAFVLKGVVDAYPVKSVRDIKVAFGFFKRTYFTAGGKRYTLDDIEHRILREQFGDPRIHAAINCASGGCPRMPRKAFRPDGLEARLEAEMRFFLQEPRNVRIDREQNAIYLSEILKWFETDFTGWYRQEHGVENAGMKDYLMLYLPEQDRRYVKAHPDLRLQYVDYDWTLNDQAIE